MNTRPIPSQMQESVLSLPSIQENGEALLPVSSLSAKILVKPYYFEQQLPSALSDCYLRESVCQRLVNAAEQLPSGYSLVVFDGWRPLEVQQAIYMQFKEKLLAAGWTQGALLDEELSKYVAAPVYRPEKPLGHLSGGAVDLTITGPDGLIPMGTDFDDFSRRSETRFFEEISNPTIDEMIWRDNRRWLYHLMINAGFVNYSEEWWHYDFGNIRWAQYHQVNTRYGGVLSLDDYF